MDIPESEQDTQQNTSKAFYADNFPRVFLILCVFLSLATVKNKTYFSWQTYIDRFVCAS